MTVHEVGGKLLLDLKQFPVFWLRPLESKKIN